MVENPKQIPLKLKSLQEELERLKKEIGNIHREIEIKHHRGEDITALVRIEEEKLKKASNLLEESNRLIDKITK